jgi:integrase
LPVDWRPLPRRARRPEKAVKEAGLTGITCHTFRHTFATRLLAQGTDIVTVKELLGHAEIKTTMRYAHTSKAAKKKAVSKLSVKTVTDPSEAE